MKSTPDVLIAWVAVNSGVLHKLLHLQERMEAAGISTQVLVNTDPPFGVQVGIDLEQEHVEQMKLRNVSFLSRDEIRKAVDQIEAKLYIFNANIDPYIESLVQETRAKGKVTAQLASMITDFTSYGADFMFAQHPLSIWYEIEYSRSRTMKHFARTRKIFMSGNVLYEPILNRLTTDVTDRESFLAKYSFSPDKPLFLFLPTRVDAPSPDFGTIVAAAEDAGYNVAVKMHPWEYKRKLHNFDSTGMDMTSVERWGGTAIEERDASWAIHSCDVAMGRVSATIYEMPFWEKPFIHSSPPGLEKLGWMQAKLMSSFTRHLPGVQHLRQALEEQKSISYDKEAFAKARRLIMPDRPGDSFDMLIEDIQTILSGDVPTRNIGSMRKVRRMYKGYVPDYYYDSLRMRKRFKFWIKKRLGLA